MWQTVVRWFKNLVGQQDTQTTPQAQQIQSASSTTGGNGEKSEDNWEPKLDDPANLAERLAQQQQTQTEQITTPEASQTKPGGAQQAPIQAANQPRQTITQQPTNQPAQSPNQPTQPPAVPANQPVQPNQQANQAANQSPASQQANQPIQPGQPTEPTNLEPKISNQPFSDIFPRQSYNGPKPMVLLILDGWGIGPSNAGNAIMQAHTPNMDKYWMSFPHTQLAASGQAVGLPQGEDGNTETGHLNIGAGHIVYQDLPRINMAIADGSFQKNSAFINAINHVEKHNSTLHLMGLIGSGGVHSNIEHLYALLNVCKQNGVDQVYIHGFTDGRDSPPNSGINYVRQIMERCQSLGIGKLASLMGRYYAMDRDKKWERIEKAYNALTLGTADQCVIDPVGALQEQYQAGTTDEFIEPIIICDEDGKKRTIEDNDAVIFFNYRIDRPRELTRAFVMPDFESGIDDLGFDPYTEKYEKTNIQEQQILETFDREKVVNNLYFVTMTRYEKNLPTDVAFPPQKIKKPLCQTLAEKGLRQLRMAETEKEKFVTYYMNGQEEKLYPGEDRVIFPSKGVKSYDHAPEMSAREIGAEMIERIRQDKYDVIIANLCNADMVGHTGQLKATIEACSVIDEVVGQIVDEVYLQGGVVMITADHGNAEELINNHTGQVDTEHSAYPVPLLIIGQQFDNNATMLPSGILADIAPTMLDIIGIPKPDAMTGRALAKTIMQQ